VRSSELCGGGRLDFCLAGGLGAEQDGGGRGRRREREGEERGKKWAADFVCLLWPWLCKNASAHIFLKKEFHMYEILNKIYL